MSISTTIKFDTSDLLTSRKDRPKLLAINHILQVYNHWGFISLEIRADGEFDSLTTAISELGPRLNSVLEGEHVPGIERYIRTVK